MSPFAKSILLGKDNAGAPAILVEAASDQGQSTLSAVSLDNLTVAHHLTCRVTYPDGNEATGEFSIVRCSGDADLYSYFLWIMGTLLAALGTAPSANELADLISRLVDLFRAGRIPPQKSTQGLWAEVFIIARSSDVDAAIRAWHYSSQDIYDFNSGVQRLEVKSFSGRRRLHHFSLEQLNPPVGTSVIIASVTVESSGGGVTIEELSSEIMQRINSVELAVKLQSGIAAALGSAWRDAIRVPFDRQTSNANLRFFDYSEVPTIATTDVSPLLSAVQFVADCSSCESLSSCFLTQAGGLFAVLAGEVP